MSGIKQYCFIVFLLLNLQALALDTVSPVGTWQTIDEATNTQRSIVQIWDNNGQLQGKIIKIYYREGEKDTDVCDKCTDPQHKGQRILGMTILWGMQQKSEHTWSGGQILDPKNGKIYHCKIGISPNGKQLTVRGYIGTPLFGRTQTWVRVS